MLLFKRITQDIYVDGASGVSACTSSIVCIIRQTDLGERI